MIEIQVIGLEKVQAGLATLNGDLSKTMEGVGGEVSDLILNTEGVRTYPPGGDANSPPPPFYVRGQGTQTMSGNRGNSERLGTRWTTDAQPLQVRIGNIASYAPYVHGEEQASFMAPKGWRKIGEVAQEKVADITRVVQGWIDRLIVRAGL